MAFQIQGQLLLCTVVLFGLTHCINIDFDDGRDGFFLKSTYHKFKPSEPTIVKELLILTHPAEVYKLRASYGPFEMYQSVPNQVLSSVVQYGDVWDKSESVMHRQVVHNMDVSAHLVGGYRVMRHTNPMLQLLVHAQPLMRRQSNRLMVNYYGGRTPRWCARLFFTLGEEQYTSACVVGEDTNACVAGMLIPKQWWQTDETHLRSNDSSVWSPTPSVAKEEVLVFYDLSGVRENQECASVSNNIAQAEGTHSNLEKKFITSVKLLRDDHLSHIDHRSENLVFHVPADDLAPGVNFEVPVSLNSHSPLKKFVIQVQVSRNVVIDGASTDISSPWNVFFEAGDTDHTAMVTALLKDNYEASQSDMSREVMRWQFHVHVGLDNPTVARVTWTVNPPETGSFSRDAFSVYDGSRVTAKVNILPNSAAHIVPVLKERSLLNTAILSGKNVTHDLIIYSVAQDNTYRDVTKEAFCKSEDPDVLKVMENCEQIYLNGSETKGSKNVTVEVQVGLKKAYFSVRVWIPEPELDIQLSDPKLSQVRRWKVPRSSRSSRNDDPSKNTWSSRGKTNQSSRGNGTAKSSRTRSCVLKYQQSQIEVYSRFVINTPGEVREYYRSRKTFVRVTSMVLPHITVEDKSVAKMVGDTVQGVSPGRTRVLVKSPVRDEILGSKDLRVAKDKVDLERLLVRVISGMGLHINKIENIPGALLATVQLQDQLVAKQQEAVLDIAVEFKDGTMLPLSSIEGAEYELKVTSVNNKIVEVTETASYATSMPPSIKAIGDGKGEIIKVTLKEKDACERKKPRTLDTEYVHVQVDFAKDMENYNLQSDSYYPYKSQQKHYANKEAYFKDQKERHDNLSRAYHGNKFSNLPPKAKPDDSKHDTFTVSGQDPDMTKEPKSEALEQAVSTKASHPTPLEVAMYVLVAVFLFGILVFTANCAVFMMRHQRKCKPHSSHGLSSSKVVAGSISQAPDWVWIGRATLERQGAGNAGLDHALMAEEDFNGNQMVMPNSSSSSSSSRPSSTHKVGDMSRSGSNSSSSGGCPATSASSGCSGSNRNSMVSTYQGSECSIRITSNPLPEEAACTDLGGMGYNEAEWDYEAMGMTYEQLMEYFDNLKESSA